MRVFVATRDGASEEIPTLTTGETLDLQLSDARTDRQGRLRFVMVNTGMDIGDNATVEVSAQLGTNATTAWIGVQVDGSGQPLGDAICDYFNAEGLRIDRDRTDFEEGRCWEEVEPGTYSILLSAYRYGATTYDNIEVEAGDVWVATHRWWPCDVGVATCEDNCWNADEEWVDCGGQACDGAECPTYEPAPVP